MKKVKHTILNTEISTNDNILKSLANAWNSTNDFSSDNSKIRTSPYKYGMIDNLFDVEFLSQLKQDLMNDEFYHKSNDLYEFYQSEDLKLSNVSTVKQMQSTIYSPQFIEMMSTITGISLETHRIDISSHRYPPGGYLLCHDDDIGDTEDQVGGQKDYCRRIAFIVYLTEEDWNDEDGGDLLIFDTSDDGVYPRQVVDRISPRFNRFAFFEVSPTSFHQVDLVCGSKERLSISGWFHGKRCFPPSSATLPTQPTLSIKPLNDDGKVRKWMNPVYSSAESIEKLAAVFLEQSCVELCDFLDDDLYDQVVHELLAIEPTLKGPANAQSYLDFNAYSILKKSSENSAFLREFLEFMCSLKQWLEQITQLTLFRPSTMDIRQFKTCHYTLLHDHFTEPLGLDLTLFLQPRNSPQFTSVQGCTLYVADSETLLTVKPHLNKLSLVLRDEGTMRFVKLLDKKTPLRMDLSMVWLETTEN